MQKEAEQILMQRFGGDSVISLATVAGNKPYVRSVNAFYENGSFYVLTYALSNKMRQLAENPNAAISGEWFTASARGINLGFFGKPENGQLAAKMRAVFVDWIDNGHTNLADENTCILQLKLEHGVLLSHGTRFDLDF